MGKKKKGSLRKNLTPETATSLSVEEQEQLCRAFGFQKLYPHQISATSVMAGSSDLLLLAGTSQGKTEALLGNSILHPERGLTVLIEPLRALQAEMLRRLEKLGSKAVLLNSDLSSKAYDSALASIRDHRVSYVLTTPEQLEKKRVFRTIDSAGAAVVIVDEVHCLLDYGGDFRPAYDRIGTFINHLNRRPVIAACTATLAPDSIQKVERSLYMKHPVLIRGPTDRPEIRQNIVEIGPELTCNQQDLVEKERFRRLKMAIENHLRSGDAAIIYCNTVKQTQTIAEKLRAKKYHALEFYADLASTAKAQALHEFQSEKPPIIVATSAFGMGIDKPNVRLVVHMSMPLSIEDYWQKTGRAGRDGKKSHSYLFWFHGDYRTNQQIINHDKTKLRKLDQLRRFLLSTDCCVQKLRSYFGEDAGKRCKHCSRCKMLE